jgi:hypothetical protein
MSNLQTFDIESDWVHIQYPETSAFRDVYGFASQSGMVNIEGIRLRPKGKPSKTLLFYMHPASTLQILPVPKAMAADLASGALAQAGRAGSQCATHAQHERGYGHHGVT